MVVVTFCTSGAAIMKAGKNVSSEISGAFLVGSTTDYAIDHWIAQAESTINAMTRYNWTDDYSGMNDDVKKILEDVASDLAAIKAITWDMSGYTSRVEAEDLINVLRDSALRGLAILRDKKTQKFISDPSTGSL